MVTTISVLFIYIFSILIDGSDYGVKEHLKTVDQVLWIVEDLESITDHWANLGFTQVVEFGTVDANCSKSGLTTKIKLAKANLGGANITWIQTLEEFSIFSNYKQEYGEGAMSLVHRLESKESLENEIARLGSLGISVLENISIVSEHGNISYVLMDTKKEGKYILGYTYRADELSIVGELSTENSHDMQLNQYAFAVRDAELVSRYWQKIGLPAFDIRAPELNDKQYYGKPANYELIQGWQKHGNIDYEWCIPVKPPTVYEDHINKHGEGIHHLAFQVDDIDKVLNDYLSKGFFVSMSGSWGEMDKPGSGVYAYIDRKSSGGLSLELLWNYHKSR
jgi:hypothetical protein